MRGSRRSRTVTLQAHDFLHRFLQHVLPTGFQKVRYYGFTSVRAKHSAEKLRWLISLQAKQDFVLDAEKKPATPPPSLRRCADCGGPIRVVGFIRFAGRAPFDTS